MKRIIAVSILALAVTGCGDSRECLDYDTRVVSTTTFVNGRAVPSTSVVTVCVEYAEEE